jgi:NADPH:quinone reductase-like Zn-dependent oxidoreductase
MLRQELEELIALWDTGTITPVVDSSYPFARQPRRTAGYWTGRTPARSC